MQKFKLYLSIVLWLFVGCISATPTYAAAVSVDVPLHHWTYNIIDRFVVRGIVDMSHVSTRPLTRLQMSVPVFRIRMGYKR